MRAQSAQYQRTVEIEIAHSARVFIKSAMPKKRTSSSKNLLVSALSEPDRLSRHAVANHREVILVLLQKNFTQVQIAQFLHKNGVSVHRAAIGRYMQKHPPTQAEVARIKEMLAAKPTARRDQEPGRAVRQPPAPHKSSQRDAETPEEAASRKRREEILARARKNCPPPQPEEEDTTDYSFLDVQGRPFRIKPDA
jgi:hypothetical protein